MQKNHKGITLIALIITIIVMIILVGVTVTVAINGNLFRTAQKAAYQTEVSTIKEAVLEKVAEITAQGGDIGDISSLEDLELSDELQDKYEDKFVIIDGTLYYDPEVVTDEEEREWLEEIDVYPYDESEEYKSLLARNVEVGDYVNYFPGTTSTYTSTMDSAYEVATDYTFTSNNDIKWKVLRIENNNVILISDEPITDDSGNYYKAYGSYAWYMLPTELNNICAIYGNGEYAEYAKSIDFDELCKTLGCEEDGISTTTYYYKGFEFDEIEYNRDTNYYYKTIITDEEGNIIEKEDYQEMNFSDSSGLSSTDISGISAFVYVSTDKITWTRLEHHPERFIIKYTYGASSYSYLVNSSLISKEILEVVEYTTTNLSTAIKNATSTKEYEVLFQYDDNTNYWLANTSAGYGTYRCYRNAIYLSVSSSSVSINSFNCGYADSWTGSTGTAGIRPIVVLKADTQTSGQDENGAWNLK